MVELTVKTNLRHTEAVYSALTPRGRQTVFAVATRRTYNLIQSHFLAYANAHHDTADRLGAKHTKHMERAARDMSHESHSDGGEIHLTMAGIGRAFHDVEIHPVEATRLTIPISRESYGKRAREVEQRYGRLFMFRSKAGNDILAANVTRGRGRRRTRTLLPLYLLRDSVFQRQDPDMLPTEQEVRRVANEGIEEGLRKAMGGK